MLGSFFHASPSTDNKGKNMARAVAWWALTMGVVMALPSVVLPP